VTTSRRPRNILILQQRPSPDGGYVPPHDSLIYACLEPPSRAGMGPHDVAWHGETDRNTRVASGVYYCRMIVDGMAVDSSRLVLVQ
jgi:hypothetical protein